MRYRMGMLAVAVGALATAALARTAPVTAQEFPARQIRLMVGFAAGGSTDVLARALAQEGGKLLGQEIIVVNKGGAAGTIAVNDVATSPPDGYTIGITPSSALTLIHFFQSIRPDLLETTEALLQVGRQRIGLATKSDSPVKTFKEFVAFARANPGKATVGTPGAGTTSELMVRAVARQENLQISFVPFQGDAPVATAVLGGHVTAGAASAGSWAMHVRERGMRLLVSMEADRIDVAPEVPTLRELGYPLHGTAIQYMFGPKGLPPAVKKRLIEAFTAAAKSPLFVDLATTNNLHDTALTAGEALDRHLIEDRRQLGELVAKLGMGKK